MRGKTVIVTGGSSGIGLEAADALARKGASLILIDQDASRSAAAARRIAGSGAEPKLFVADLSCQADVRRVATEILVSTERIDVLINNAGAMFGAREVTADGLERSFALNHMAYFLLTWLLLDRIVASAPARIVSVSSSAHHSAILDFDDLQTEEHYSGLRAYERSKLANVLFTRALADRLRGSGVTSNCLHPGLVKSGFFKKVGGLTGAAFSILQSIAGCSLSEGARTTIYLASSREVEGVTGKYFVKCKVAKMSKAAQDDVAAERLWSESMRLAGLVRAA